MNDISDLRARAQQYRRLMNETDDRRVKDVAATLVAELESKATSVELERSTGQAAGLAEGRRRTHS